ncbi:hypothetical protein TR51_06530 [Kitasatospora griseola]|uniref:Uncharacterized protein n=1 Tax=Kitasatospora griseola TaxID=2064 RepID=A0A0D0Q7D7_KITGR|nr:hypothetical protein [Kitasatospora griseola]KIQ67038.1 hypothetical protein TR51_06530 [Kitasatospora griseola]
MTAPADDHLTVLVDRACRGVATPTEGEQLRAAITTLRQQARVDTTVWCLREEMEQTEAMYLTANRRADRYRAAWRSARARAHHARCVLADYRTEADARKASQEACDHRDPNRLGHRPSDLATVCACGHLVSPPILPADPR